MPGPRADGDFEGTAPLPHSLRGPGRRWMADAFPAPSDSVDVGEVRMVLGTARDESWLTPAYDAWLERMPAREAREARWEAEGRPRLEAVLAGLRDREIARHVRETGGNCPCGLCAPVMEEAIGG